MIRPVWVWPGRKLSKTRFLMIVSNICKERTTAGELCWVELLTILPHEPWHDKTNKMSVRPAKIQISLGICPVWSESSLSAWRNLGSLATHWAHSEDSDQTGRMPRLIWVFAGRTLTLLVLSCRGSHYCATMILMACRIESGQFRMTTNLYAAFQQLYTRHVMRLW